MPANDNSIVDRLLNEFIQIKKGCSRDFHVCYDRIASINRNHRMDFPRGNNTPAASDLANSASKMEIDGSGT